MKLSVSFIRSRYLWAVLAGILLALSFPKPGIAGLAWIAPGLLLFCAVGCGGRRAFWTGYLGGLAHYLTSLAWLLLIPVPLAWKWAPVLGWTALSAFLALYPALWVWLCWRMFPAKIVENKSVENPAPPSTNDITAIPRQAEKFLAVPWAQRTLWAISTAALWVALEMTVARFLGGFPWNLLGDSQYRLVPLIQIASYTGVYGVSFLIIWTSVSLLGAAMVILRRPAARSALAGEVAFPALVVLGLYGAGYQKLTRPEPPGPTVGVALVQPSIPQDLIWDPKANSNRFAQVLELSRAALTNRADICLWPEAAVPEMLRYHEDTMAAVARLARSHHVWMIIGSDDAEPRRNATGPNEVDYFNSSFLISPEGELISRYIKRNLVIFGEYVPWTRWLPFLKYLTPIEGGFTPGDRPVPFDLRALKVKVSVLICFEDVFPQLVRDYVSDDTDFLVNLTNNGWFGEGSAQWQHAAAAIFRAVENGVPLVRCANNGLTCWVDEHGRIREIFSAKSHGIYGPGFLVSRIPVLAPGEKRVATYYRQHGDIFGWTCVAIALAGAAATLGKFRSATLK